MKVNDTKEIRAMGEVKLFSGEKLPLEMHKVRVVQKLNLLPVEARQKAMADAGRYRHLFDCPEPFCYRGEVFETKVVADNAIDTDMRKTP